MASRKDFPNAATARKVQVTYAVAFAQALKDGDILPINFVFCSGAWAEREQDKELWYLEETRKIKVCYSSPPIWLQRRMHGVSGQLTVDDQGEAEAGLAAIAESTPGLNVYHMRLGGVMANTTSGNLTTSLLGWSGPMVSVGQVAAVFVDVALRGDAATNSKTILENDDIVNHKFEDGMRRKSSVFSGGSTTPRPSAEGRRGSWLGNFGRKGSAVGKSAV